MNERGEMRAEKNSNFVREEVTAGGRNLQYAEGALIANNREDRQIRQVALSQACHDLKGDGSYEDSIERARAYFVFLQNG